MNAVMDVNITSREFKADPYPFYARLRAEAPVYPVKLPQFPRAWLLTRYDDVLMALKDTDRFTKDKTAAMTPEQLAKLPWMPPPFRPLARTILDVDGDEHGRLRGLIHKAFTPKLVEGMQATVQTLADELIDAAEKRGHMDIIHDYALPIPLTMISRILGIPEKDKGKFHRWTKLMIDLSTNSSGALFSLPALMQMLSYLRGLFKERAAHPRDDLVTALVQAEEGGDRLTEDELLAMVFTLLIAGHETTVNLIGSGTLALIENPDQMRLLRRQPDLIRPAIEELVRYVAPVEQATERYATQDITLHGVTIPRGELVLCVLASANRDERQFPDGDLLDITRAENRHLSFGMGAHYCVGAPLARLEGQIAISTMVRRLPGLKLDIAPTRLRWRAGITIRGLEALPVAL